METEPVKVVVLGGGQTGARACLTMRQAGFTGPITLIGDEPHLPYERPNLSKAMLLEPGTPEAFVMNMATVQELGVGLELGRKAVDLDRTAKSIGLEDGLRIPYDRLLLATGCRVRPLNLPGYPSEDIFYLRTVDDARALERRLGQGPRVVIVGGGFIGLEVAAAAQARGCAVIVLEMADRLLPRIQCREASDAVLSRHLGAGLDIRLGVSITDVEGKDLVLSTGDRIRADLLVAGVGVQPNTELAAAAGLRIDDGVITDQFGRTSDPYIFAAGDVTRQFHLRLDRSLRLESWQNANCQAEAAAKSLVGALTAATEIPWVWSDQGSVALQIVGAPDLVDEVVVRQDDELENGQAFFQFRKELLVGAITLNRGKDMPLIRRWLAEGRTPRDMRALSDGSAPLRKIITDEVIA